MKILRKLRVVSILVAFAILAGQFCTVNVNAAQGVEAAPVGTKLSGFRIIDLDRPVAGRDLDFKARVRTNENVTWEIPVIWTDENGNTAYKAEPGKTYYPNFAFFIPAGYQIDPVVYASKIFVRLPDFLIELYGESSVVFASDASLGITYITFTQAVESGAAARAKANEASIAPALAAAKTSTNTDEGKGSSHDSPAPQPAPADPFSNSVRVHCSAGIIEDFANCPEVLEEVVSLIKNKLEPQAVALLKNAFTAYRDAEPSAFGEKLGLYIYNRTGNIDGDPTPANALAYVSGGFSGTGEDSVFHYLMGVDVSSFMTQDDDGKWYFREDEKVNLNSTIVHEMMHAYMYDLTRRGMCDNTDGFPSWFTEGMAVSVENAYQFRSSGLQPLSTAPDDLWSEELKRYTEKVTYSVDSIVSLYSSQQTGDNRYQLKWSNDDLNVNSAYVSGYLAVIYLGYLAAERTAGSTSAPVIGDNGVVNVDRIRDGLSSILTWIHEGCSLETVIKFVSTSNLAAEGQGEPRYASVAKFEEKFIQGSEGENEGGIIFSNDGDRAIYGSAKFTEVFLNFLEDNSRQGEGLDNTALANGSVLRQDQNYQTLLDWESEPAKTLYAMTDEEGAGAFVTSTADNNKAWNYTGGRTEDHGRNANNGENNSNVVEFPASGEAGTGVAASVAPTEGIASSDSSASGSSESSSSSSSDTSDAGSSSADNVATGVPVVPADTPAAADTPAVTDTSAVAELPAISGEPVDIANPDMGITDVGQDLIILPTEQDAITPDEITAVSSETISSSEPAPPSDSGSSSDASSDSGSSDGGSSDSGSSSDSVDSGDSDSE